MSSTEIEAMDKLSSAVESLTLIMDSVFSVPPQDQFAALFLLGLVLPVVTYQVAWAIGKLLSMFGR